jgi:predicted amidohydrolase YtcJ
VQLLSSDGRTLWVNSQALKLARMTSRDAAGVLDGEALEHMQELLPEPTPEERSRAIFAAIAEAQRHGITSLQDADGQPADFETLNAARKSGPIDMRIYSALPITNARTDEDVAALGDVLKRYPDDPLFKAGAAKIETDGIGSDALNKLVRLLDDRGWQVMIEAESPDDTAMARMAFTHAERSNARPARERRHRLEHQQRHFTRVGSKIALGSDWPYGPLSPMDVIEATVPRFSMAQALQAYTVNGAYASYDEQRKGFIKAGMLADMVVLSDEIFSLEPDRISNVRVAYTIFDGRVVYPAAAPRTFTN